MPIWHLGRLVTVWGAAGDIIGYRLIKYSSGLKPIWCYLVRFGVVECPGASGSLSTLRRQPKGNESET